MFTCTKICILKVFSAFLIIGRKVNRDFSEFKPILYFLIFIFIFIFIHNFIIDFFYLIIISVRLFFTKSQGFSSHGRPLLSSTSSWIPLQLQATLHRFQLSSSSLWASFPLNFELAGGPSSPPLCHLLKPLCAATCCAFRSHPRFILRLSQPFFHFGYSPNLSVFPTITSQFTNQTTT